MTEEITDDNRQFEAVLSRLDALMKRSHAPDSLNAVEAQTDPVPGVPVLTEVYQGAALVPVKVADEGAPPTLTEFLPTPLVDGEAIVDEQPETQAVIDVLPEVSQEQAIKAVIEAVMPMLQEMVENVVREELFYAQQNVTLRIVHEAEQMLRQRLLQDVKPK